MEGKMTEINPNAVKKGEEPEVTPKPGESATPGPESQAAPAVTPVSSSTAQQPGESDSRYQKRIDQLIARAKSAEERAMLMEEKLNQLEASQQTQPAPGVGRPAAYQQKQEMVGEMTRDAWEEWQAEDAVAAYRYMADISADMKAKQIINQMQTAAQVEGTINEVYKAHPELKEVMNGTKTPEETPFWQVYDEVAREMPDAQNLAKGPIIVMREAERRMREREAAVREKEIAANAAQQESERQSRVRTGHTIPPTGGRPNAAPVKLTQEEEITARKMGMTPEEYAKFK